MMKRREGKGAPSADLLVCFPTKYAHHLTLMPKPICSPAHPNDQSTRHHRQNSIKKKPINTRNRTTPTLWPKTKSNSDISSEPTSPKINCAGQIKVRSKPNSCKNWQSVMEEIERLHEQKKRGGWVEALGFKKDVMQFLTCLRNIRFDFRCFGAFPNSEITSDDEDEDDEDESYGENSQMGLKEESESDNGSSMLSKWFMILEENTQTKDFVETEDRNRGKMIMIDEQEEEDEDDVDKGPCAPPPNALLLMRCRSAPAKSWLEEKEEEEEKNRNGVDEDNRETEEKEAKRLIVMRSYGTEFSTLSCDIANETWVVGGIKDVLSRTRSCNR